MSETSQTKTPDEVVAETISEALNAGGLIDMSNKATAVAKIASGKITAAEWQAYLTPVKSAPTNQ